MSKFVSDGADFSCKHCTSKLKLHVSSSVKGDLKNLATEKNCFLQSQGGTCNFVPGNPHPCPGVPVGNVTKTGQSKIKITDQIALAEECEFTCPQHGQVVVNTFSGQIKVALGAIGESIKSVVEQAAFNQPGKPIDITPVILAILDLNSSFRKSTNAIRRIQASPKAMKFISGTMNYVPYLGNAKSCGEFITEKDSLTGEKVNRIEAGINCVPIPFFGVGAKLGAKLLSKPLGKVFKIFGKEGTGKKAGEKIGEEVGNEIEKKGVGDALEKKDKNEKSVGREEQLDFSNWGEQDRWNA